MAQCPYHETFVDRVSGQTETNGLYMVWHQGYEAHKFENAKWSIMLASLVAELDAEVKSVKELKKELETQRAKFEQAN